MICSTCHGSGKLTIETPILGREVYPQLPCAACNGTGSASCCEGAVGGPCEVTNGVGVEGDAGGGDG